MTTLIVGDVHACADELSELISKVGPDRTILVGDVFNKGPKPAQTWSVVEDNGVESVVGNHDLHVIASDEAGTCVVPPPAVNWLRTLPLTIEGDAPAPWVVVHAGVDPVKGVRGTSPDQAVRMRHWPISGPQEGGFWWEKWSGPPLVIYGHDAIRGLQDRRPHSLGLDTGCVYGGRLTGYLVEADRLVSVPARSVYHPVG